MPGGIIRALGIMIGRRALGDIPDIMLPMLRLVCMPPAIIPGPGGIIPGGICPAMPGPIMPGPIMPGPIIMPGCIPDCMLEVLRFVIMSAGP
jgi:hypothetical protein